MTKQSTLHLIIFGSIGVLSASLLFYYMFWYKPRGLAIKDGTQGSSKESTSSSKEDAAVKATPRTVDEVDVVVEDADSSDGEDEDDEDAGQEALRSKYEDANRLAQKYISGQAYAKAVEKLSEALSIAPKLPSAGRDLVTLYNNRSAMYEKQEMYDKSLADISVVLTMDANHLKARIRRARIYDVQVMGSVHGLSSVR
jgi:tetratricopeptide (TPR) repeat protein